MELQQVGAALANETRRKILRLIAVEPDSAVSTHRRYLNSYSDDKHRESIYRGLETLVEADILVKDYDEQQGLIYQLKYDNIRIDLHTCTVIPDDDEESG